MIDAERLVRLRGLAKRQFSRRARLLHHVYTWLRIIGESTFILHDHQNSKLRAWIENPSKVNDDSRSGQPVSEQEITEDLDHSQLDDFLRVESRGPGSDCDGDGAKDNELGYRDIHLEDSRPWSDTLYMDVYGIPEIWLSLVSQTTRVANIMDFLELTAEKAPRRFTASLQRKTTRLEHMICTFAAQHSSEPETSSAPTEPLNEPESQSKLSSASRAMLRALSSGLVIFFYRRIRKVHPWILQGHVNDVMSALKDFDHAQDLNKEKKLGTPWPAYIAGCEAISSSSRNWYIDWLRKGAKQSAFNGFTAAQQVMQEVWERRDATKASELQDLRSTSNVHRKNAVYSWVDVLREGKFWLMLY